MNTQDFDVLVLGAGMAGLSAATEAANAGARVAVLERAPMIGGSAAVSGGYVWAPATEEDLRQEDRGEYQIHGAKVVAGYSEAHAWLSGFTAPLTPERPALAGRGRKYDLPLAFSRMSQIIQRAGGMVFPAVEVSDIVRDSDGGFLVRGTTDAGSAAWRSRTVIVATGGRQADPNARAELSGGAGMALRGNAYSAGGGMNLAVSLGGMLNLENKGFYGHLFAAGVTPVSPVDFIAFALYQSEQGILLDPEGTRFADETRGDHNNATSLAAHGGRGLLMWSEVVQAEAAAQPFVAGSPQMDRWQISKDRGGRVGVGSSLAEVAEAAAEWGYSISPDLASDPVVSERLGGGTIYFAEVVPAITYTFGGVRADARGEVLNSAGEVLGGVYVAGADMSDIYHKGYGGGLCAAVVTGREAGRNASEQALGTVPAGSAPPLAASPEYGMI